MHIKTRLDLIMEALQASQAALRCVGADGTPSVKGAKRALEKIEIAYDAAHGTEERPGT